MKFQFWSVGKAHEGFVSAGIELYTTRLQNYYPAQWKLIAPPKHAANMQELSLKLKEGEILLNMLSQDDYLIALDERGKNFTSEGLATFIQQRANESTRNVIFLIGGGFGLDAKVLKRANVIWSLSSLVFPHQLVRLILAEQVYRACTILKNEKYHHA
ncbi:MAG: 23S rRNA (pseudouridine(1915)-N(3))-methyltransferase RlmH [Ferruginibacter sp.]